MLYCIESKTCESKLVCDPSTPVLNIIYDFAMTVVQISEHHVVCISLLVGDIIGPSELLFTQNLVDTSVSSLVVVVNAGEVVEVVLLLRVLAFAARERELGVSSDVVGL